MRAASLQYVSYRIEEKQRVAFHIRSASLRSPSSFIRPIEAKAAQRSNYMRSASITLTTALLHYSALQRRASLASFLTLESNVLFCTYL